VTEFVRHFRHDEHLIVADLGIAATLLRACHPSVKTG